VLVDDNAVRAMMTASWLEQMGLHEAVVLERALLDSTLLRGPQGGNALGLDELRTPFIDAPALAERMAGGGVAVVDVERSLAFRRGHLPGARHAVRGHLELRAQALPAHELLVLTSADGMLARYCVEEAAALGPAEVRVLEGGTAAWAEAGLPLEAGSEGLEDEPVDAFLRPYDRDRGVEEAMQSYLDWEIALLERLDKDGTLRFRTA